MQYVLRNEEISTTREAREDGRQSKRAWMACTRAVKMLFLGLARAVPIGIELTLT